MKRQPHSATTLKKWRGEESPSVLRRRGCQQDAPRDGSPRREKSKKQQNQANKALRGGSWYYYPHLCRSAYRNDYNRRDLDYYLSFRVVCGARRTL